MSEAPSRRDQIVVLLQTRDEGLPLPVRRGESTAGFVHRTLVRESCPDCLANDRAMPGCVTCGGRGYRELERQRDPFTDTCPDCLAKGLPMKGCKTCRGRGWTPKQEGSGRVLPYGFTPDRHEATQERDRQIDRLGEQLQPPRTAADLLADANARPYGWEQARRRLYAQYDYRALDLALDVLRSRHEAAYHVLHSVFVYCWQTEPGPAMSAVADAGLVFLDERLLVWGVDPIRAPGSLREAQEQLAAMRRAKGRAVDRRALEARNAEMCRLHAAGRSVGELVERFEVATSTVYSVVYGETA